MKCSRSVSRVDWLKVIVVSEASVSPLSDLDDPRIFREDSLKSPPSKS
jgi:hypothetical protein